MRHRSSFLFPLLALLAAAPSAEGRSLPFAAVTTAPSAPAPGDPIVLKLSGQWPDSCVPDSSRAQLTREGFAVRVNLSYSGQVEACLTVIRPWSLEFPMGQLAAGTYVVEVTITRSLMPVQEIGKGEFVVKIPEESVFWVPGFAARGSVGSLASTLSAFNNSGQTATVTMTGAWDALGERVLPEVETTLAAGEGASFDTRALRPGQQVQMLAFRAPTRMTLRATLERLETVPEGLPKPPLALGRVELPVFTELVPAGMTAVAGDVSFSAEECGEAPAVRRRVNLTVFNAGKETASFVLDAPNGSGDGSYPMKYDVPASSLVQFNDVPTAGLPVCSPGGAFLSVTANQPFLAYVSSSRPETVPGVLPYEIFPALIGR